MKRHVNIEFDPDKTLDYLKSESLMYLAVQEEVDCFKEQLSKAENIWDIDRIISCVIRHSQRPDDMSSEDFRDYVEVKILNAPNHDACGDQFIKEGC